MFATKTIPLSHEADRNQEENGTNPSPKHTDQPVDWVHLVNQVSQKDEAAMEQLYKIFKRGISYYLCRQLGPQDLEDKVHDTFVIVVKAIQRGDLREPERLMGFVRTVCRRQVAGYIEQNVRNRRNETEMTTVGVTVADPMRTPEQEAILRQTTVLVKNSLADLSNRDREILMRFYLQEQSQKQICEQMDLTETQFRLTKSRAKAKFGRIGKKKMAIAGPSPILNRAEAV